MATEVSCHTLVLAMGVQWRTLDVPEIERFQGAGVYYGGAAATEAMSCRDEDVYIVGGANSPVRLPFLFKVCAARW